MVSKVFVCHCSAGFRIPELEGRDSWCHSTPCAINHRWWVAKQLVGQGWVGKWQKYRRLYDSRVCQHLTWLTFWIAQHFVVPLFLGILQPEKDAPSPSVSDFLTLKTIQVSPSTLRLMWLLHARKVPTSQSLPSLSLSLYRTISIHLCLLSMWITHPFVWTHPTWLFKASGTVSTLPQFWFGLLSTFLSHFLNGKPNKILVSTSLFSTSGARRILSAPSYLPQSSTKRDDEGLEHLE